MGNEPYREVVQPEANNVRAVMTGQAWPARLVLLPPSLLLATLIGLWLADLRTAHESESLLLACNILFSTAASLLVAVLVGRSFIARGSSGLLLLGCGVVVWGAAGTITPLMLPLGINAAITAHNALIWLAALCHLTGVLLSLRPFRPPRLPGLMLALGYTGALCAVWLVIMVTTENMLPVFFVQDAGGTPLRSFVLGSAAVMFVFTAMTLWRANKSSSSPFMRWYAGALLLIATGLLGIMIEEVHGGWVSWTGRAAQFLGGAYMLAAAIAAARETAGKGMSLSAALRASEERYRDLFDSMVEGFAILEIITDEHGAPVDFRFLDINPAFDRMTGLKREQVVGRTHNEVLPGDDPKWVQIFGAVALAGKPAQFENYSPALKRHYSVIAYRSAPRKFAVIFTDITDRKKAEDALRESEERFRLALKNSPVLVAMQDSNLVYQWSYNTRTRQSEDIAGKTDAELFGAEELPSILDAKRRVLKTGNVERLALWVTSNGQRVFLDCYFEPLRDSAGNVTGVGIAAVNLTEQKRAEEALRESERRYRTLYETLRDGFVQVDMDGRIINCNDEYCRMLGYSPDELYRLTYVELTPERWHGAEAAIVRDQIIARGYSDVYEKEYRRKDGAIIPVELRTILAMDTQGRPTSMWGIVRDISERKRAEEALATAHGRIQSIIDNTPALVYAFDLEERFTMANTALAKVLDSTPEKLIGKRRHQVMPKDDADWHEANDRRVIEEGKETEFEEYSQLQGRSITWLTTKFPLRDSSGKLYGVGGISSEITERKQMEEALRDLNVTLENKVAERTAEAVAAGKKAQIERQRLLDVLETLPAMICLLAPDYHITFANKTFRDKFGESGGRPCYEHRFGRKEPCSFCESYRPLKTGLPHHWEKTLKDGTLVASHDFVFTDADGSPLILEMDMDITLQRQNERALAERTDQLRALASDLSQTEQRERRRLAKLLHDDIQQLLVAARMQLGLIKRADPEVIQSTVQGIDGILSETLEASRSLTVELCPPVLHQSGLVAALSWLAARMEEKQQFRVRLRTDSAAEPTNADERAFLFDAARELLLNSFKYSGTREAHVTMLRTKDSCCRIICEDKGRGFDPASVKAGPSGGFGLFSIQQRLLQMGGHLEIESAFGQGTKAVLTVPIGQTDAAEVAAVAASLGGAGPVTLKPKGKKISVLLVDDHKIMRQGLSSLMQFENDLEVVAEAENGQQALEMARKHEPDVVIMDVNMPVMDGIQATRILTKELPQSKVVALSMHLDNDAANVMREAGAVAFLTKGGPLEDLIAAIRACARLGGRKF